MTYLIFKSWPSIKKTFLNQFEFEIMITAKDLALK